jgi:hypothetical protein
MALKIKYELGEIPTSSGNRESDGRRYRRYPLSLPLQYRVYGLEKHEVALTGSGRTVGISTGGVIFEADRALPAGREIDLSITWPASLSKSVGLTLRVMGRLVRADQNRMAMVIKRYEFRTRSLAQDAEQETCRKEPATENRFHDKPAKDSTA